MGEGISRERAIEIASNRISGHVTISPDSTLEVTESEEAFVIEWRRHLPPFVDGRDYDVKVWVEKGTGRVLRVLAGS